MGFPALESSHTCNSVRRCLLIVSCAVAVAVAARSLPGVEASDALRTQDTHTTPPARLAISVTIRAQLQATVPTTFVHQTDCALNRSALRLPAWCGRSIACCECYSVCYAMRCSPTGVG